MIFGEHKAKYGVVLFYFIYLYIYVYMHIHVYICIDFKICGYTQSLHVSGTNATERSSIFSEN